MKPLQTSFNQKYQTYNLCNHHPTKLMTPTFPHHHMSHCLFHQPSSFQNLPQSIEPSLSTCSKNLISRLSMLNVNIILYTWIPCSCSCSIISSFRFFPLVLVPLIEPSSYATLTHLLSPYLSTSNGEGNVFNT